MLLTDPVQDFVLLRQKAEDEFISSIKGENSITSGHEHNLRTGFLAGFYEAYRNLKELNKVHRRINRKTNKKRENKIGERAKT